MAVNRVGGAAAVNVLIALAISLAVSASLLSFADWDPSALLRVGEDDPAVVAYFEEHLDSVRTVPRSGHDGKFYFMQASDPLLLDPDPYAGLIRRPVYRLQRMLYPLLASVGGLFGAWGIVWALLVVNLLALGAGTWATTRLAVSMDASPLLGLAFVLNPGMLMELIIDGAGILAWALAVFGLWYLSERRFGPAILALTLAVLAREAMILVAIGSAVFLWRAERWRAAGLVAVPAAAAGLWGAWVRFQLGLPVTTLQSQELGGPLGGLIDAFPEWVAAPGRDLIFGLTVIALLIVALLQTWRRPSLISFSTAGFSLLGLFLTRQVWLNYFDISRAVAPLFTTFVMAMFVAGRLGSERAHAPK